MSARVSRAGQRVGQLREHKGWSVRQLAARSKVSHTAIGQLERGEVLEPHRLTLEALADAFGWPSVELLLESDELEPPARGATERLPVETVTMASGSRAESGGGEPVWSGGEEVDEEVDRDAPTGIHSPARHAGGMEGEARTRGRGSPFRLVPAYRYGTVGDPADPSGEPDPTEWVSLREDLVRGERARVGTGGWGVVLGGNELSNQVTRDGAHLQAGWSVFCNPATAANAPPEAWEGRVVVALSLAREIVAGVLEPAPEGASIGPLPAWVVRTDTAGLSLAQQRRTRLRAIYGPAVWFQPPGYESTTPAAAPGGSAEPVGPTYLAEREADRRAG